MFDVARFKRILIAGRALDLARKWRSASLRVARTSTFAGGARKCWIRRRARSTTLIPLVVCHSLALMLPRSSEARFSRSERRDPAYEADPFFCSTNPCCEYIWRAMMVFMISIDPPAILTILAST